jgi:hypothetical protein
VRNLRHFDVFAEPHLLQPAVRADRQRSHGIQRALYCAVV